MLAPVQRNAVEDTTRYPQDNGIGMSAFGTAKTFMRLAMHNSTTEYRQQVTCLCFPNSEQHISA